MDIKIFISYKNRHTILKSDILTPIQTGRAVAQSIFEDMLGDDTGENISSKNEKYNELTAQYWVWKNYNKIGNPDYIGFMHHRRHFIFNNKQYKTSFLGTVRFDRIDDNYLTDISLRDREIRAFVGGSDLVCIRRLNLQERAKILKCPQCATPKGCYWYNRGLKVKDYDLMLKVLEELHPEYARIAYVYTKGNISFGYNSFIMRKELFYEYNEFLFPILFELEKRIDFSSYCKQGIRTLGYLGERLLSIFILKKLAEHKYMIKETPMTIVTHTMPREQKVIPIFGKNVIVFTSSNFYAPYTAVAIKSLIINHRSDQKLDIVILTKDMSEENKTRIFSTFSSATISIRFCDIGLYSLPKGVKKTSAIDETTYYRLFIPKIFKFYDKVLFLDSDIIVLRDLDELFSIDTSGVKVGAALDVTMQCFLLDNFHHDLEYVRDELGLKNPSRYYNAGVMLFDMRNCMESDADDTLSLLEARQYTYFDQDVINKHYEDSIMEIPLKWNYTVVTLTDEIYRFMPVNLVDRFAQAGEDCSIVHYNSSRKPWKYPASFKSDVWWKYAKQTPYYEEIIARLCDYRTRDFVAKTDLQLRRELTQIHFPAINGQFLNVQHEMRDLDLQLRRELTQIHFPAIEEQFFNLFTMLYYTQIYLCMLRCCLLKFLCFGVTRQHYIDKYTRLHALCQRLCGIRREWKRKVE